MNDDGEEREEDPLADRLGESAVDSEDADGDPFEHIGEGTGPRHGDPFDAFEEAEHPSGQFDETARADPTREGLPAGITDDGDRTDAADASADDPFTEFDEPTTDPFGEGENVFDGADGGDVDGDGVWERMESGNTDAEAVPGKRYVDVNKHSYCETCEYFSEPPEITCSHEGTDILEFVDVDTVRVANCPIVAERKALEDSE